MSEEENKEKEIKNLENVDYKNKKERVATPYSRLALSQLGIKEEQLYEISKEEYLQMHPELKYASSEVKNKRYDHFNKRREEKIEKAKKLRNEIIEEEKKEKEEKGENELEENDDKKKKKKFQSGAIKKELEKLEMIKKQQLGEIKNIIDYAYKKKKK